LSHIRGSYSLAAACAAAIIALGIDKFHRRNSFLFFLAGLCVSMFVAAFSQSKTEFLVARFMAGLCSGPLVALSFAAITDYSPIKKRASAIAAIMSISGLVTLLGVPCVLEISRLFGWHTTFLINATVGLAILVIAYYQFPKEPLILLKPAVIEPTVHRSFKLFWRKEILIAYALVAVTVIGSGLVAPHLSGFLQFDLGMERHELWHLYLFGGSLSLLALQCGGWLVDKYTFLKVATGCVILGGILMSSGYVLAPPVLPISLVFAGTTMVTSLRTMTVLTLSSRIPNASERGSYMALQTMVQHLAMALGTLISGLILEIGFFDEMTGMEIIFGCAILISLFIPYFIWRLETKYPPSI